MGAETSATHTIFFIAAIVIATSLVGVFTYSIDSISEGIESRRNILTKELASDITIINDPSNVPYSGGVLTIYVKNTGEEKLYTDFVDVLVDGEYQTTVTIKLKNDAGAWVDSETWDLKEVIRLQITVSLSSGDHTVKVIPETDVSDRMDFKI